MTNRKSAPEIFQLPLSALPLDAVLDEIAPGSPEYEQAVIMHFALKYADKGWLGTGDR
jgi:hypothetical protein